MAIDIEAMDAEIMARIHARERLPYRCPCCGRAVKPGYEPTTSRWYTIGGGFAVCAEHVQARESCRVFRWEHSGRMDALALPLITWSQSMFDSWAINMLRSLPEVVFAIEPGPARSGSGLRARLRRLAAFVYPRLRAGDRGESSTRARTNP